MTRWEAVDRLVRLWPGAPLCVDEAHAILDAIDFDGLGRVRWLFSLIGRAHAAVFDMPLWGPPSPKPGLQPANITVITSRGDRKHRVRRRAA